jgi:hypothetical protein
VNVLMLIVIGKCEKVKKLKKKDKHYLVMATSLPNVANSLLPL